MIPVVWYQQCRGNWDSGLLCSIFEQHPDVFPQYNTQNPPQLDRAIVIVAGKPEIMPLRCYLDTFKSGVVILTSEEDSYFAYELAIPRHMEIWTQYYAPNKASIKERLLLGEPNRIKDYKINLHLPKKYLWSFVGQVQNPFREACVNVLKKRSDGFLRIVQYFGGEGEGGMDYQSYLDILCQSKFVFCPAGSMCVDSFRVYEAIKCNAVPITNRRSPRDPEDFNYWKEVYPGADVLTIEDWEQMEAISDRDDADIEWLLKRNYWWEIYKGQLRTKLLRLAYDD